MNACGQKLLKEVPTIAGHGQAELQEKGMEH